MPRSRSPRSWSGIWCATSTPIWPIARCGSARVAGTTNCGGSATTSPSGLPWATRSADALLRKEYAWLPALAPRLPLPIPVPQRFGEPSERFPRPWIVTTWVPGAPADRDPATRAADAAKTLAAFLTALHQPAPGGAPAGRDRGGPLADRAEQFAQGLASATELGLIPDPDAVRAVWQTRSPRPSGRARRCGSTATCIRPTSSPRTAPSAA